MTKICKKVAQHFHCAVSKVFDRVKSVALWSANIRKLAKGHRGYGFTDNWEDDSLGDY
jgi:DNA-binding XRE family transcriptional regulator